MFEYKIIKLYPVPEDCQHQLNTLGDQGWELVTVNYNTAYLKRKHNWNSETSQ